jgi:type II secretion system-associated lipoprotein
MGKKILTGAKCFSKKIFLIFCLQLVLIALYAGCGKHLVLPEKRPLLNERYAKNKEYILRKKLEPRSEFLLSKGTRVKIFFKYAREWIKVYAYKSTLDRLNASPVLAIFITKKEARNEKFDPEEFDRKFYEIFQAVTEK